MLLTKYLELCRETIFWGQTAPNWSKMIQRGQLVQDNLDGPKWSKDLVSQHRSQNSLYWVEDMPKLIVLYLNSIAMNSVQVGKTVLVK